MIFQRWSACDWLLARNCREIEIRPVIQKYTIDSPFFSCRHFPDYLQNRKKGINVFAVILWFFSDSISLSYVFVWVYFIHCQFISFLSQCILLYYISSKAKLLHDSCVILFVVFLCLGPFVSESEFYFFDDLFSL